jgi:hypothetical protein
MAEFKEVFDQLFVYVDRVIAEHKKLNDYEEGGVREFCVRILMLMY